MNAVNYDAEAAKLIGELKKRGARPKLLLHACCAPCASACVERVKEAFDTTLFFYNPNMDGKEEYDKRAAELLRLAEYFSVKAVIADFLPEEFFAASKGLEKEPERGARCDRCFYLRLSETVRAAKSGGYDYFATTLTLSPLKNSAAVNSAGFSAERNFGVKYLPTDFKKRNGYLRSLELSRELGLYRQSYCGCVFSKNARTDTENAEINHD